MDAIDAHLMDLLQADCSRSLAELGKEVGLSVSAVKERLSKLRARGDVRAYVALINPRTLGYALCAFVQVRVDGRKNEHAFLEAALRLPEVQECHHVSGDFSYLLKMWARSLQDLEQLVDRLKSRSGVARVHTSVVLSSPKDQVTGMTARP